MPGRMIGDAAEHIGEVVLWVDAAELGAFDQRVDGRGATTAGIGAGEEVILAADGDAAQGPFGRIVVERQAAIVEAACEGGPAGSHIAEGGGELGFARELGRGLIRPGPQCRGDRF